MAHPEDKNKNPQHMSGRGKPEDHGTPGRGRMHFYDLSVDDVPLTRGKSAPGKTEKVSDSAKSEHKKRLKEKQLKDKQQKDKQLKEKQKRHSARKEEQERLARIASSGSSDTEPSGGPSPHSASQDAAKSGQKRTISERRSAKRSYDLRAEDDSEPNDTGIVKRRGKKRRRRLPKAFAAVIIVMIILAAGFAATAYFLKIGGIAVKGKCVYTSAQITEASGLRTGDRLVTADRAAAIRRISVELPYILSAKIKYVPPDGLTIEVTPDTACICVKTDAGYTALDAAGKVLGTEKDKTKFADAVETSGVDVKGVLQGHYLSGAALKKALTACEISSLFRKYKVTGVTSVDVTNLYEIKANYSGRVNVLIGTSSDLDLKIRFAADLLTGKDKINETDKGELDVSETAQTNKARFIPS